MAVPKRKVSKQRGNKRFANWKIVAPQLVECAQCHELKSAHKICPNCGFYKGVKRVEIEKSKKD